MARRRNAPAPRRSAPVRQPAVVPQQTQLQPQPAFQQQKQPGLIAQTASIAAGSAIGHTIGHALTGAFSGGSSQQVENQSQQPQQPQTYNQQPYGQQQMQSPCQYEMQQFINCSQNQMDLSLCDGLNQILKECRLKYTNPM